MKLTGTLSAPRLPEILILLPWYSIRLIRLTGLLVTLNHYSSSRSGVYDSCRSWAIYMFYLPTLDVEASAITP